MKALVCEMCNSNDLVKQDGMYVCQNCGTKYTVEEARKLMIEGTVDVSGSTVKIDNEQALTNFIKMASSAYIADNFTEAENYCNKAIEIDPDNAKALLIKGKAAGWQSNLRKLRLDEAVVCFFKAIDKSPEEEKESTKKDAVEAFSSIATAIITLACNNFAETPGKISGTSLENAIKHVSAQMRLFFALPGTDNTNLGTALAYLVNRATQRGLSQAYSDFQGTDGHPSDVGLQYFIEKCTIMEKIVISAVGIPGANNSVCKNLCLTGVDVTKKHESSCSWRYGDAGWTKYGSLTEDAKNTVINLMMEYYKMIKDHYDPNFVIPERPTPTKIGGCYIATAVYGSYDCPQVWTLRRYRDFVLAKTWFGRAFIKIYYSISPSLVKHFGHTKLFNAVWKKRLDNMVMKLNNEGFANSPYNDKEW